MASPLLEVAHLSVARGDQVVVQDLSLTLHPGEALGLLGPNGAGKTSAFQALVGLLPARGGEVRLNGRSLPPGSAELRRAIGVVFQEPALDRRLKVEENLHLAARLQGVPAPSARIDDLLQRSELGERAATRVDRLSGGLRRRVDLLRALVHAPDVLILDEPTSGLDEASFRRFWADIRQLRESRGLSVLVTTHRPEEAEQCNRLTILDQGHVVAEGETTEIRQRCRGDVIEIEADRAEELIEPIRLDLGLDAHLRHGRLTIEDDCAHQLVPRLVEALPEGRLRSISLHRAGLADVVLALTGRDLDTAGPRTRP